jgi:hypothetical protein
MKESEIVVGGVYRIYGKKWTFYKIIYIIDNIVLYSTINLYHIDNTATESSHYRFCPKSEFRKFAIEKVAYYPTSPPGR